MYSEHLKIEELIGGGTGDLVNKYFLKKKVKIIIAIHETS